MQWNLYYKMQLFYIFKYYLKLAIYKHPNTIFWGRKIPSSKYAHNEEGQSQRGGRRKRQKPVYQPTVSGKFGMHQFASKTLKYALPLEETIHAQVPQTGSGSLFSYLNYCDVSEAC